MKSHTQRCAAREGVPHTSHEDSAQPRHQARGGGTDRSPSHRPPTARCYALATLDMGSPPTRGTGLYLRRQSRQHEQPTMTAQGAPILHQPAGAGKARAEGTIASQPTLRQAWHRERTDAAICVQDVDVQCVLQFTLIHTVGCALHRHTSRVIHRLELSPCRGARWFRHSSILATPIDELANVTLVTNCKMKEKVQ